MPRRDHRRRPLLAALLGTVVVLALIAVSVVTSTGPDPSSSASGPYAVLVRDGDLVVFEAKGTGVSAPAAAGDGYALYANAALLSRYEVRLVESPSIRAVRPHVEEAVADLGGATGQSVAVAEGYVPDRGPSTGEVDVVVTSSSPCHGSWLGCATPVVNDGRIIAARIWINPRLLSQPVGAIDNTVRHELGHALGLAHFNDRHQGEIQVMHATSFDAAAYRAGDIAGFRALMDNAGGETELDAAAASAAASAPATSTTTTTVAPEPTAPASGDPTGSIETIRSSGVGVVVRGTAQDPDQRGPITVVISMDGTDFEMAAGRRGEEGSHGFEVVWPADPGEHEVCVRARNVGAGEDVVLGCERVRVSSANLSRVGISAL